MTLETLIADAVERGVLAALTKLNAAPISTIPEAPDLAAEPVVAAKKSSRSKKVEPATEAPSAHAAEPASVITDTPLPPPAPAPLSVTTHDIEADRAKLIALTSKVPDGRKVATELIRQHGPKFDGLAPEIRAGILAELASKVTA